MIYEIASFGQHSTLAVAGLTYYSMYIIEQKDNFNSAEDDQL